MNIMHRYATDHGMTVWHIIDMSQPRANFDPALCGATPGVGTWIGYMTVRPSWQTVCADCERLAGGGA